MEDIIEELEAEIKSLQYDIEWQNHYMKYLEDKNCELDNEATTYANYMMNSTNTYKV